MKDPNKLLDVILVGQPSVFVEKVCKELCLGGILRLELDPKCIELDGILHHSARGIWFLQGGPQRHICQDCNRVGFKVGA